MQYIICSFMFSFLFTPLPLLHLVILFGGFFITPVSLNVFSNFHIIAILLKWNLFILRETFKRAIDENQFYQKQLSTLIMESTMEQESLVVSVFMYLYIALHITTHCQICHIIDTSGNTIVTNYEIANGVSWWSLQHRFEHSHNSGQTKYLALDYIRVPYMFYLPECCSSGPQLKVVLAMTTEQALAFVGSRYIINAAYGLLSLKLVAFM